MAKELTEDELNLRRKARRRLIGAIALTLAVVVILPMILDSEPKPAGQDIDLRIPSPDSVGKFEPGVAASAVAEVPTPVASAVEPAPAVPAKAALAAGKPAEPKGVNKPASGEGFVVQVGAFSNAVAAKQELTKLRKWGYKAYTEKAGDTVRVRAGPYAEREKAEKVRQLLENRGLNPVVMSAR